MFIKLSKKFVIVAIIIVIGLVALGVALGLILTKSNKGGIATNGYECAGIGRDIINKGGSAADAAVAALFCEGVAMPQSTGLGGGFFLTIYTKETGKVETLDAREMAPNAAYKDMYKGNSEESSTGGKAVAVPGELRGYEAVHRKYGKLPWRDIIQPTIDLCRRGHYITPVLAKIFKNRKDFLKTEPSFKDVFIDPDTNEPYIEGQYLKRIKLAETLEIIANEGADALYNGSLTAGFVKDITDFGGIITIQDMNDYRPIWREPVKSKISDDLTLYTFPLPGSGFILSFILNLMKGNLIGTDINSVVNWQRIVESLKFAYGERTKLGDPGFNNLENVVKDLTSQSYVNSIRQKMSDTTTNDDPEFYGANTTFTEDHGTAHISVLAPNGDAVSATGTINLIFGSKRRSMSTGIILNDEMDDFSSNFNNSYGLPPSPANYIEPGKRPMSSMCPTIIVNDDGEVRLVIGGAGGSKITTSIATVTMKHLWLNQNFVKALNGPRLHHQLFPMEVEFESTFPKDIVEGLEAIGHAYKIADAADGFAAVTGISSYDGEIEVVSDPRRKGSEVIIA